MREFPFSRRLLFGLLLVVVICAVLLRPGRFGYKNLWLSWRLLSSGDPVGGRMMLYTNWHAYDKAVQVGLKALRNESRNDSFVYDQIASVYLIRAGRETNQREEWVAQAATYIDKELAIHRHDGSVVPGFDLLEDGVRLAIAGDLSVQQRCMYYRRSVEILREAFTGSQADHVVLHGEAVSLEPVRREIEKRLSMTGKKMADAGCVA